MIENSVSDVLVKVVRYKLDQKKTTETVICKYWKLDLIFTTFHEVDSTITITIKK